MEICFQSPEANGGATAHKGKPMKSKGKSRGKNGKKLVGIRQRPSGRWVAEIKDTTKKIRMWLGTFETAEEAARAYDEAACLLRGANTRTNFIPQFPSNSPIASRIRTLLNDNNNNNNIKNNKIPISKPPISATAAAAVAVDTTVEDVYKPDMSNCLEETDMGGAWDCPVNDEFSISEDFEKMKVERQISASLYAINGVHEYMEAVLHQDSDPIWDLTPLCSLFS